jgi:glucose-1-phosphate adenylyltransferase
MIEEGRHVLAYPISGYWADIGTVERYHLEQMKLLDRPNPLPPEHLPRTLTGAPPRFVTRPGSLVGDDVDVPSGADVRSSLPTYISDRRPYGSPTGSRRGRG